MKLLSIFLIHSISSKCYFVFSNYFSEPESSPTSSNLIEDFNFQSFMSYGVVERLSERRISTKRFLVSDTEVWYKKVTKLYLVVPVLYQEELVPYHEVNERVVRKSIREISVNFQTESKTSPISLLHHAHLVPGSPNFEIIKIDIADQLLQLAKDNSYDKEPESKEGDAKTSEAKANEAKIVKCRPLQFKISGSFSHSICKHKRHVEWKQVFAYDFDGIVMQLFDIYD